MTTGTSGVQRALSRCDSVTSPIRQTLSSSGSADPAERDEGLRGCKAKATPASHLLASRRTFEPPPARCQLRAGSPLSPAGSWFDGLVTDRIPYRVKCGYSIPGAGVRHRTSWPLAIMSITDIEVRVRGRGILSRLGLEALPTQEVVSAQALTGRFGRGLVLEVRASKTPWYIFTFRAKEVLDALKNAGVDILPGSRRVGFWDQI